MCCETMSQSMRCYFLFYACSFWKIFAKISYESEMKNGISNMTDYELMLSSGYKDYLKNGITTSTLYHIIAYEIGDPIRCE